MLETEYVTCTLVNIACNYAQGPRSSRHTTLLPRAKNARVHTIRAVQEAKLAYFLYINRNIIHFKKYISCTSELSFVELSGTLCS